MTPLEALAWIGVAFVGAVVLFILGAAIAGVIDAIRDARSDR